jgi:hypothetical protein
MPSLWDSIICNYVVIIFSTDISSLWDFHLGEIIFTIQLQTRKSQRDEISVKENPIITFTKFESQRDDI